MCLAHEEQKPGTELKPSVLDLACMRYQINLCIYRNDDARYEVFEALEKERKKKKKAVDPDPLVYRD